MWFHKMHRACRPPRGQMAAVSSLSIVFEKFLRFYRHSSRGFHRGESSRGEGAVRDITGMCLFLPAILREAPFPGACSPRIGALASGAAFL